MALRSDMFVNPPVGLTGEPLRDERRGGMGPGPPDTPGVGRNYRRLTPQMFGVESWEELIPPHVAASQREEIFKWLDGLETALVSGNIQQIGPQWRQVLSDWNRTFRDRFGDVLQQPAVQAPAPDVPLPDEFKGGGTVLDPRDEIPGSQPVLPVDPVVQPGQPAAAPPPFARFNAGGQLVADVEGQGPLGVTFRQARTRIPGGGPSPRYADAYNPYTWFNNKWNLVQGASPLFRPVAAGGNESSVGSGLFGQFHDFQGEGADGGFSFYRPGTAPSPFVKPPPRPRKPGRRSGGGNAL